MFFVHYFIIIIFSNENKKSYTILVINLFILFIMFKYIDISVRPKILIETLIINKFLAFDKNYSCLSKKKKKNVTSLPKKNDERE